MAYGELKVDSITFTDGGSDATVSVSGLIKNPTFSGDIVVNGNISGTTITGAYAGFGSVTGVTVTGTTANFVSGVFTTQVSGTAITGDTAGFTVVTGTTVTGTTANFVTVSGTTVTGDAVEFTSITGDTAGFTTVTGTTVTGTTANFVSGVFTTQVSGVTITGDAGEFTTLTGGTAGFTTVTGTTVTGTTANFATVSGTTVTGDAGNFTTATVTSGVFASGTAAAPSVSVGATDNGLYSPGTDQVAISTNGTGRLFVDASGEVGIGAPTPLDDLHIASTTPGLLLEETDAGTDEKYWRIRANGSILRFEGINDAFSATAAWLNVTRSTGARTTDNIAFNTGTSERLRITPTGQLSHIGGGSAGSPAVGFNGSAPSNSLVIDSTGKVGIGTNSPDSALNVRAGNNTSTAEEIASFSRPDAAVRAAINKGLVGGTTNGIALGTTTNHPFALNTNGSERLYITNTGNVGIGTTSPATLMHLSSATGSASPTPTELRIGTTTSANDWSTTDPWGRISYYTADVSSGGPKIHAAIDAISNGTTGASSELDFKTVSNVDATLNSVMRLTHDGKVGIGTTNPRSALTVTGQYSIDNNTTDPNDGAAYLFQQGGIGWNLASTNIAFSTGVSGSRSERARIDSSGRLLVGTVPSPAYKLQLETDSAGKPSTNTWTIVSDERIKEEIELADLDLCYEAVKNIPLKRFKWKDEVYTEEQAYDRRKLGWIAQDVEAVFPKAVRQHEFKYNQVFEEVVIPAVPAELDDDGNVITEEQPERIEKGELISEEVIEDCRDLNSDQLYAAMYGAIQKLISKVELLEAEVQALKAA